MKCVALDKRNASLESNGRRNYGSFASLETFNRVAWKFLTQEIKRLSLNCTEIISALSCVPCSRFPHNEQTTIVRTCRMQRYGFRMTFARGKQMERVTFLRLTRMTNGAFETTLFGTFPSVRCFLPRVSFASHVLSHFHSILCHR